MKNSFQLPSIALTSLLTIMVALPCYGKHTKKVDSGISKKPADSSTATNGPVSFTVRSSQIDEGRWSQTSMKASAGQLVEIQVTTIDELRNPKAKPGKIQFRAKGDNNSQCSVSFGKSPKVGQTKKTSLTMSSTGSVEYNTEGSLSVKVTMKLRDVSPNGSNGGVTSTVNDQQAKNGLLIANWVWGQLRGGYRNANMTSRGVVPTSLNKFFKANMMGNGYVTDGDTVIMGSPRSDIIEAIVFSLEYINEMGLVMVKSGRVYIGYDRNSDRATLLEVEAPGIGSMNGSLTATKSLQDRMMGDAFNQLGR